jgi:hypothetical protein
MAGLRARPERKSLAMARYFFAIHDLGNGLLSEDPEGTELPSLDDAIVEARETLGGLLRDTLLGNESKSIDIVVILKAESGVEQFRANFVYQEVRRARSN